MLFSAILFVALPLLIAAAPAKREDDSCHHSISTTSISTTSTSSTASSTATVFPSPTPFTIIAAHSASPIHLQPVNAVNQSFFIGVAPSSYCPKPSVEHCPAGTTTTVAVNGGAAFLAVEVPGGQQIYVQTNGALGFTAPHSASIPTGAYITGFALIPGTDGGLGDFGFSNAAGQGFLACPTTPTSALYQVFVDVKGFKGNLTACIGFDALTSNSQIGAWEYT
ncbi:hypothetical protein MMC18_003850 [Xylographa bjoerkii]|nr:hypothetical protein [Xylographa bjoerkii]